MVSTKKTQNYSLTLTLILWLTATLIVFFAPMQETEKVRTMQVSLSLSQEASPASSSAQSSESIEVTEATENVAVTEVSKIVESPAPRVERAQPTPQTTPRQSSSSPAPSAPAPAPQVLAPDLTSIDIGGSVAQSTSSSSGTRQVEWPDENEFVTQTSERSATARSEPTPTQSSSQSSQSASSATLSQFEGTAGQSAQVADSGASAVSDGRTAQSSSTSESQTASSQTASALGRIEGRIQDSSFSQSSSTSSDISYNTLVRAAENAQSDGISIEMRDGTMRRLIEPKDPSIVLSAQSEALIDSSKLLRIQFTVLASGNVSPSSVSFSPAGLIPPAVQEEIRSQIAQWRFESAQGNGQAAFQYSINKG